MLKDHTMILSASLGFLLIDSNLISIVSSAFFFFFKSTVSFRSGLKVFSQGRTRPVTLCDDKKDTLQLETRKRASGPSGSLIIYRREQTGG